MPDRIGLTTHAKIPWTESQVLILAYFSGDLIPVYCRKSKPTGRLIRAQSRSNQAELEGWLSREQ